MQPPGIYLFSNTDLTKMVSYNWDRFTGDNKVSLAPCAVGCVILTADGQGTADITLYDGESTSDPEIIKILTGATNTKVIRFQPPLITNRGLYLDVGAGVDSVLIQYERHKETA